VQAKLLQRRGGERGAVALVAEDDPWHVVIGGLGNVGITARVAAPLQVVAFDDDCAGYLAVGPALDSGLVSSTARRRASGARLRPG
jgi:hypothetical protein